MNVRSDRRSTFPVWILIGIILARGSDANFNLYLTTAEVQRILGLPAQLYYIREGVVNDYAMRFSVKVAPQIHAIYFSWEALTKRPVLYNMAVWINSTSTETGESPIEEPSVNVSLSGTIPVQTETFQLSLPCTGLINGEVEVILNLNVTSPRPNKAPTVLYFSRRKICLKGIAAEKLLPRKGLGETNKEATEDDKEEEDEEMTVFAYVSYGLISFGLVIALITGVACWKTCHNVNKYPFPVIHQPVFVTSSQSERKSTPSLQKSQANIYSSPSRMETSPSAVYTKSAGLYAPRSSHTANSYASVYKFPFQSCESTRSPFPCKCTTESLCSGIYESSCCSNSNSKTDSYFSSKNSKEDEKCPLKCKFDQSSDMTVEGRLDLPDFRDRFGQLQMDRERVRLTEVLQEGKIGRVYKGWLQREHPELDQQVVIKTLREGSPADEVDALCRDGTLLSRLRHQNLMSLVGMSFATNSPPFLIYPDPQGKNFKLFLKEVPLKVVDMVEVCLQAARGLSFMHAIHIHHKDIAARNCTVNDQLELRLTDGALSKDFFPHDYERRDGENVDRGDDRALFRPLRWMPPETMEDLSLSSYAADIWSLGVLLWEASTQGDYPYRGIHTDSLVGHLEVGERLHQPSTCPDELHRLMSICWGSDPRRRPSAHQVVQFLTSFRQTLDAFV